VLALGFFISLGAFLAYSIADNAPVIGSYGAPHATWVFLTGGNAGLVKFDDTPLGYSGAQIYKAGNNVYLTGIFWADTVGWMSFSESPLELVPPTNNVRDPWTLSGLVWSQNGGWISFSHGESYASWVFFLPDNGLLIGNAWSDGLGWIPFWDNTSTGVQIALNEWFIWKVSVEGQIVWSKTFNVLYDLGWSFNSSIMTSFVNQVRKNVALIIRNAGSRINTTLWSLWSAVSFNKAMIFNITNNGAGDFLPYSQIQTTFDLDARSLITIGADILIDVDILETAGIEAPRSVIALRNENGEWGNIYVKGSVKEIHAVLFSEGSIISWDDTGLGLSAYYITKPSLFTDIPPNQLYIKWWIGWHNTIGWWSKDGWAICPYVSDDFITGFTCNYDTAIKYDWNYFRIFKAWDSARRYNPSDASRDNFSVIIDYDPRVLRNPPPGLENINY
jgi:hypothetical protein